MVTKSKDRVTKPNDRVTKTDGQARFGVDLGSLPGNLGRFQEVMGRPPINFGVQNRFFASPRGEIYETLSDFSKKIQRSSNTFPTTKSTYLDDFISTNRSLTLCLYSLPIASQIVVGIEILLIVSSIFYRVLYLF